MAIKTTIQNLINSLIRSNPALIDKTEHADVEDALLLNSYGNVINETQLVNTITKENASNPNLQYNVFFCKQGRKVTIKGNLVNQSTAVIGDEASHFFQIVDSEYLPSAAIQAIGGAPTLCANGSGEPVMTYFYNDKLIVNSLGNSGVVYLNIEYLTEN